MQRLWIAGSLMIAACGASGPNRPATTTSGTPDPSADNVSTDPDVTCASEVRTGTHLERNICRSSTEKDQDKRTVQELYLNPSSRPGL